MGDCTWRRGFPFPCPEEDDFTEEEREEKRILERVW